MDTWRFRQYKKFLWRSVVRLIYVSVGPITETVSEMLFHKTMLKDGRLHLSQMSLQL